MAKGKRSKPSLLDRLGLGNLFRRRGDDKLINEYEEIVRQNPDDYRARIKLAEFYAKQGNLQRAEEEFLTVAKSYKEDGFNLKAIATYKQVLKLNPDNSTIILELADLYKRQGLIRDAIDQYHAAIVIFQANTQKNEVLHVLKRMSELSHESVDLGLKLADLFAAEGYTREASDQLLTVAGLLAERGERDRSEKVLARLLDTNGDIAEGLRVVQELYDEKGAGTKASMVAELAHEVGRHGDLPTVVRRLWGIEASDSAALMSEPPMPAPAHAHPHGRHHEPAHEEPLSERPDRKSLDDEIENFIQSYNWSDEASAEAAPAARSAREPDFLGGGEDPFASGGASSDAFSYEPPPAISRNEAADEPLDQWANPSASEGVEDVLTRALSDDSSPELEHRGEAASTSWLDEGEPRAPATFGGEEDPELYRVETEADDRIRLKSDRDYLDKMPSQIDPESLNPNNAEIFTRSGFERVFGEFKKGLEQQIGVEDADTHYNLGIAYKEMALIDDAIHEFEIAAQDPTWRADALTMIALCHEDNEDLETAIDFLKEALDSEGISQEKATGLLYEIGLAHEALARYDEAYDYFSKVYAVDEDYRNVKKKLADLLKEL